MTYSDKVNTYHIAGTYNIGLKLEIKEVTAILNLSQGDIRELKEVLESAPPNLWKEELIKRLDESLKKVEVIR